jgi:mRNA-degrading endonuclease toxin of MazEF toxin-antitoxin module
MRIARGDIYFVFLDPVFGRELGGYKTRPVAVVSVNDINDKPLVALVVPGTSTTKHPEARSQVLVRPSKTNGLKEDTMFQCHQPRALDKGRFVSWRVGRLDRNDLERVESAIKFSLGLV